MVDPEALELQDEVEDAEFQRLLTALDEDADEAEAEVNSLFKSAGLKWLPAGIRGEAAKDLERVKKADALFHAELKNVAAEKGQRKRLLATYDAYSLSVGALQQRAAQLKALSDAGVLQTANAIAAFLLVLTKNAQATAQKLLEELQALEKDLATAKRHLKEAKAQGIINGVLTIVTVFIPHVGLTARLLIGAGKIGANAVIDELLGPKDASATHSAQHSLFELAENYKGLSKAKVKLIKGGAGLFTTYSDWSEIKLAESIIAKIKARMRTVDQQLTRLLDNLGPMVAQIPQLQKVLSETKTKVAEAATRAKDAKVVYDKLRELIASP